MASSTFEIPNVTTSKPSSIGMFSLFGRFTSWLFRSQSEVQDSQENGPDYREILEEMKPENMLCLVVSKKDEHVVTQAITKHSLTILQKNELLESVLLYVMGNKEKLDELREEDLPAKEKKIITFAPQSI